MKKITIHKMTFGCDPELFFRNADGTILGAEHVVPENGFLCCAAETPQVNQTKIIIDGVQAELNPTPRTSGGALAGEIATALCMAQDVLLKPLGATLDFSQLVEMSKREMDSISEKHKVFGCSQSYNVYSDNGISHIDVDARVYNKRSAGGHIHIGAHKASHKNVKASLDRPNSTIPLLDILVGNTCVLLDRDSGNKTRREVYGKAGEYRKPVYGLEYRTPSNFWLRDPALVDMITRLTQHAVSIAASDVAEPGFLRAIFSKIRMQDVVNAINNNDIELAKFNLKKIAPTLYAITPVRSGMVLSREHKRKLEKLVDMGLETLLPIGAAMDRWRNVIGKHGRADFISLLNTL